MNIIEYHPVAGLTIKEALTRAIGIASEKNKIVKAYINDIIVNIDKDTNIDKALSLYLDKLNAKYAKKKQNSR